MWRQEVVMVERHIEAERTSNRTAERGHEEAAAVYLFEDIRRHARLPPDLTPQDALEAVMCTFSRHVSGGEARHVWEALPDAVKPLLDRCMVHRGEKAERFTKDQLLIRVAEDLGVPLWHAEEITLAVLNAISSRVPAREMADVASQLPADMRELWIVKKVPLAPPVDPHPMLTRIERAVTLPPGVTGMGAFVSVVRQLSRRLSLGEARHLFESLPADLRQLVEPCLQGRGERPELFDKTRYLQHVASELGITDVIRTEEIARTVFHYVEEYVPASVFEHVTTQLPRELSDVWALPERP
jgi:uncharacterized protein (DUF2267 family)